RRAKVTRTGCALESKLKRVFRMSPSAKVLSVGSSVWAAHSAFCPWAKPPKRLRSVKSVALLKPLTVSVSRAASLSASWAEAGPASPSIKAIATQENHPVGVLMDSPWYHDGRPPKGSTPRPIPAGDPYGAGYDSVIP